MTRSAAIRLVAILSLIVFAGASCAHAQTVLAPASAPITQAESPKITDYALDGLTLILVVATAILAWATWILAQATRGLQQSAVTQGRDTRESLKIASRSLDVASGQLESANAQRAKNLGDQLFEFDKLLIAYPVLQMELEKLRAGDKKFSASDTRASDTDERFVKVKSFIYMHLNFFDEIVSTYQGNSVTTVEYQDWCTYIIEKMKHPAYKDIMESESNIFGDHLRQFIKHHREEIYANNGTPWVW